MAFICAVFQLTNVILILKKVTKLSDRNHVRSIVKGLAEYVHNNQHYPDLKFYAKGRGENTVMAHLTATFTMLDIIHVP